MPSEARRYLCRAERGVIFYAERSEALFSMLRGARRYLFSLVILFFFFYCVHGSSCFCFVSVHFVFLLVNLDSIRFEFDWMLFSLRLRLS